ncbi:MAG: hypothetical protein ACO1PB_15695 [Ramlibacter sp.]
MVPGKLLLAIAAAFIGVAAWAQTSLGTVSNVNGVVTATQGATGMVITNGMLIQNGMRFVTTTTGSVRLNFNSGCTVDVPPSHGVTVLQSMNCDQLAVAVQPIAPVAVGPQFPPSPVLVQAIGLAGAAGIAAAGLRQVINNNDQPLSAR